MSKIPGPFPPTDDRTDCGLTVLRTIRHFRATKRWRWDVRVQQWTKVSYDGGAWFSPTAHTVGNLRELVAVLDKVRRDPRAFVVRGALQPDVVEALQTDPGHLIRRRKHLKNGIDPSLAEVPRRWMMVDIDNWPLPDWGDLIDDPDTAIDHAIHELLPEPFRDAECWWQLSSSAGFVSGFLKVHLFFWLTEPASNAAIKAVLREYAPGVDRAPFNAAQPHYIADPIIEGGHDPLSRRTGWRKGTEAAVALPVPSPVLMRPASAATGSGGAAGDVAGALALLGHGDGLEGFHAPLRAATLRYARRCSRYGDRDDDTLKAELRTAIRSAPCRAGGNVETPYCQDWYLDPMIEGAFALLAGDAEIQTMRPHHQAPAQTTDAAREAIRVHVGGFVQRALGWHRRGGADQAEELPEHAGLAVGVGLGKSTAARQAIPAFIEAAHAEGFAHRVLWLIPTHRLGNEALKEMEGLNLKVAVLRGREAEDPGTADPESDISPQKMCLNLPAVEAAISLGYAVEQYACGSGKAGEPACPYRGECSYQRQKSDIADADVVIAAHQSLFNRLPKEARRNLGLVIVDEAWWQAGLRPNQLVLLSPFADIPLAYPVQKKIKTGPKAYTYRPLEAETNDLHALSVKAQAVFAGMADGDLVSREAVEAAGLTADDCALAIRLEWDRKIEGAIWPGMPPEDREKGIQRAAGNSGIARRAGIWAALRDLLTGSETHTGRLQLGAKHDLDGSHKAILLHGRTDVSDGIASLPVLCLDATMPDAIVRRFLPRLAVLASVQAAAPHMEVTQVIGGWGKGSLVPSKRQDESVNRTRLSLVDELADFVRLHGQGDALVVTYQQIEDRFSGPGIKTGHFNAIAGLDEHRKVRSLFVIGRPLPAAREIRAAALALTGRAIPLENTRIETRGALMADGSGAGISVRAYADPDLEALRVAITEAEIIQAVGRGRGVWRGADRPLSVFVLADVTLPLPVTRLCRWADIRPGVMERMLARGAVFLGAVDAAKAYPDLFPTTEAAKKAIQRAGGAGYFGDNPLRISIPRGMSPKSAIRVTYRPNGRGQQNRVVLVPSDGLAGLRERLEVMLGPLGHFDVSDGAQTVPTQFAPAPAREAPSGEPPEIPACVPGLDPAAVYPVSDLADMPPADLLAIRLPGGALRRLDGRLRLPTPREGWIRLPAAGPVLDRLGLASVVAISTSTASALNHTRGPPA